MDTTRPAGPTRVAPGAARALRGHPAGSLVVDEARQVGKSLLDSLTWPAFGRAEGPLTQRQARLARELEALHEQAIANLRLDGPIDLTNELA